MKWKLLQQLYFMSKLLFYGIIIQVFFSGLLIAKDGLAQENSIENIYLSLNVKDATLKEALNEIAKATDFKFAFEQKIVENARTLTIQASNESLANILLKISQATNLRFKRVNNNIFVSKKKKFEKPVEETLNVKTPQQGIKVSGTVISEDDQTGLPGVNIVVEGTTKGTVTDIYGRYSLDVPDENAVLVFSSVGFITQKIKVGNRTTINVTLNPDIETLSEIVVVGYGTQKKAEVTGAISSVDAEEITALPVLSAQEALQGRAAGVTVINNGSPGSEPTVRIRGLNTINNNNPLYVIDGVPAGGLNQINPDDIESIEILKDASTAAIYGSRGANGVIMITTKTGQPGKTKIDFSMYYGGQKAAKRMDLLNSPEYIEYATELQENAGLPVPARFTDPKWSDYIKGETDWQDEIFQTGTIQNYNLNVSGGSDKSVFNVSTSYFNQDGIMLNTGFERYTFRANSEFKLGIVKIGETFTAAYSDERIEPYSGGRSQIEHAIKSPPYQPVYDPNNLGGFKGPDQIDNNDAENPVRIATLNENLYKNFKILGTIYAKIRIVKGLDYKIQVGLDASFGNSDYFSPAFRDGEFHFKNWADISKNKSTYISPLVSNILTYRATFAKKHNLEFTGVVEQQTSTYTIIRGSSKNSITNQIKQLNFSEATDMGTTETQTAWIAYVARLNYNFDDRYLLSASFRRDGHSRFGPEKRWGNFPAFSAGWRISEEAFMDNVSFISDLKIRGSWGQTGNNLIGDYKYQSTLQSNFSYHFGDNVLVTGTTAGSLANSALGWETNTMTNIGLDMGFLADKLRFTAEFYINDLDDMLLNVPIASSLGFTSSFVTANAGSVKTTGFEFDLGYRDVEGEFQWSVDINLGTSKNEVTSLGNGLPIQTANFEGDNLTRTEEGHPIGSFYGWVVDGIFQTADEIANSPKQDNAAPGDIKFKDIAGPPDENGNPTPPDGIVDANDKTYIGNPFPSLTYGANVTMAYKGFDFNLFFTGVAGNDIYNTNIYDLEGMTRVFNSGTAVLNRWHGPGTSNTVPRAVSGDPSRNTRASTRFVEDGSFTRLKNITIGYSLPDNLLSKFAKGTIKRLRVYVSSQNLVTITKYSGYDPEIGNYRGSNGTLQFGIDHGNYPQPRSFIGGLQISF